jgi:hypothetical protein
VLMQCTLYKLVLLYAHVDFIVINLSVLFTVMNLCGA